MYIAIIITDPVVAWAVSLSLPPNGSIPREDSSYKGAKHAALIMHMHALTLTWSPTRV